MKEYSETQESTQVLGKAVWLARIFLRNLKTIIAVTLAVMILTGVYVYLLPDQYTSTASILPSGKSDNLSALKELAGLTSAVNMEENSSALFPEIVRSNQVRDAVAGEKYTFQADQEQRTFSFKKKFPGASPEELRDAVAAITEINSDPKTGIIRIHVTTEYPALSQKILQKTLEELERYNSEIRRSRAKETARYLDRELKNREAELAEAEQRLEDFQKANQNWYSTTDPEIITSLSRLRRDIEINSQAYLLLREQFELARLNVQKDIPVVSLLDPPTLPDLKSGPRRKLIIAVVGFVVFFIAFALVLLREAYRNSLSQSQARSINELGEEIARNIPVVNRLFLKRRGEAEKAAYTEKSGD